MKTIRANIMSRMNNFPKRMYPVQIKNVYFRYP